MATKKTTTLKGEKVSLLELLDAALAHTGKHIVRYQDGTTATGLRDNCTVCIATWNLINEVLRPEERKG